jgi:hypothetical protein
MWLIAIFAVTMFVLGICAFWDLRLRHSLMYSKRYHRRDAQVGLLNVICWTTWWGSLSAMFGLLKTGTGNETVLTTIGLIAGAALFGSLLAINFDNEAAIPFSEKKTRKWITW